MRQDKPPLRNPATRRRNRKGVVAVITREDAFLTIRRSAVVTAPLLLCFPGGGIEANESPRDALVREMQEELGVEVEPISQLWSSRTPWGTHLEWWHARLPTDYVFVPAAAEVAEVMWMTAADLMAREDVLASVPQFLTALRDGCFVLP